MRKGIWILVFLIFALPGCRDKDLRLNVMFERIHGLKQGNRVLVERNPVGEVETVTLTGDGLYRAEITIRRDFVHTATEHSRFFIAQDPAHKGQKAVEIIQTRKGSTLLKDGTTVQGSSRFTALLDKNREAFERGIRDLKNQLDRLSEELKGIPDTDAFKKLEEELTRLSEEIKQAAEAVQEKIEKEALPRLREELEKLRKRLERLRQGEDEGPVKI
jgi:ABC-type transporter Mla subunit MlaD